MPSDAIVDVLAHAPKAMDLNPVERNPVVDRAHQLRSFWSTLDAQAPDVLYAYIHRWLSDDPDAPKLVGAPYARQTLYPDGRDGTLLSPGRDLATAISALRSIAPSHYGAAWLCDRLMTVRRDYLTERMAFLEEAIAHPRRRKFDALFARLGTTRSDISALQRQREGTAALLADRDHVGDIDDTWSAFACHEVMSPIATDDLCAALLDDDLDDARAVAAMYWNMRDDEQRMRAVYALSPTHLAQWRRVLLIERAMGTDPIASVTPAAILQPVPSARLAPAWVVGNEPEAGRVRTVGFDMNPLEGEIIIATTAGQAMSRLRAYGERTGMDKGAEYLIGVTRSALPDVASMLRDAGCTLRPALTTRQHWDGERFGRLMFGVQAALWVDGAPVSAAFVAPMRGGACAATTRSGLRRALGKNTYMDTVRELFGERLDAVVLDRLKIFPLPVADYGLPAPNDAAPRFASWEALLGDEACAHAGAHWIVARRSADTAHLALACPACLRTRLAVVEPHRIPEDSLYARLRPESVEDADLEDYMRIVRRERALVGDPRPAVSWEQLCRDEPPMDLDVEIHVPAPAGPQPAWGEPYSSSLEEAFFG